MVAETEGVDFEKAYKFSLANKQKLRNDQQCGCFHCITIFHPREIRLWLNDISGETALCPYCSVDTVIGESSGFPITEDFLEKMHRHWL